MAALHENTRAAAGIFSYIQVRLNNLRLRANPEAGGVLSFESGAALLQALQNHIPMEKLRRVMHVLQQGFQLHRTNPQAALAQQRQNQQFQAQQQAQLQRSIREGIAHPVSQDSAFIGQQQAGYLMVSMPHPGGGVDATDVAYASGGTGGASPSAAQMQAAQNQASAAGSTESGRDRIAPAQQQQTNLDDFETFAKHGPTPEISAQASQYFQRIYKGQIPIGEAINVVQKMRASHSKQENDVFMCMVLNLFDEYRFFGRYPKRSWKSPASCSVASLTCVSSQVRPSCLPCAWCWSL